MNKFSAEKKPPLKHFCWWRWAILARWRRVFDGANRFSEEVHIKRAWRNLRRNFGKQTKKNFSHRNGEENRRWKTIYKSPTFRHVWSERRARIEREEKVSFPATRRRWKRLVLAVEKCRMETTPYKSIASGGKVKLIAFEVTVVLTCDWSDGDVLHQVRLDFFVSRQSNLSDFLGGASSWQPFRWKLMMRSQTDGGLAIGGGSMYNITGLIRLHLSLHLEGLKSKALVELLLAYEYDFARFNKSLHQLY